jgi:hypothetical protein
MPTVYLVRHAEPADSWQGGDDSRPLSDHGRKQAAWMGDYLRKAGVQTVLTAPHVRCRETAEIIAEAVGLKPMVERALHIARAFGVNQVEGTEVWVAHSNNIPGALRVLDIPCFACGHASAWKVVLDDQGNAVAHEYIEPAV